MRRTAPLLLVTALLALGERSTGAADYFVAPAGSDANAGPKAQPFATIQRTQSAVKPGDTVFIRGGNDWLHNSAYRNAINFNLLNRLPDNVTDVPGFGHKLKNNLGYRGGRELASLDAAKSDATNNSFTLPLRVTEADFVSLDESMLTAPRAADGALPEVTFMKLVPGSQLIDRGVDVGFPFHGKAPDLGAFEE